MRPDFVAIQAEIKHFILIKCIWKCGMKNVGHLSLAQCVKFVIDVLKANDTRIYRALYTGSVDRQVAQHPIDHFE